MEMLVWKAMCPQTNPIRTSRYCIFMGEARKSTNKGVINQASLGNEIMGKSNMFL